MEQQESIQRPIVSIDKDDTIGCFRDDTDRFTLFDELDQFLRWQRMKDRDCIICTAVDEPAARLQLQEAFVTQYLPRYEQGVYGLQRLSTTPFAELDPVFGFREFSGRWYVNAETGLPMYAGLVNGCLPEGFDYFQSAAVGGVFKDFGLLRRHLAGHHGGDLSMVHISDPVDVYNMKSDPNTVMVRVVNDGLWLTRCRIFALLHHLFEDFGVLPHDVFDEIFAGGRTCELSFGSLDTDRKAYNRAVLCTIGGEMFTLGRGKNGERIIFEDR